MKHLVAASILAGALALPAAAFAADYSIMAPAAPGGGWDQTSRSLQEAMTTEGISGNVQVVNVPGAGGTIGLAQFAQEANGDPSKLMVGGYVMVGAILTNKSPVTLDAVTPIARLTGEYEVIVVPAASPLQSLVTTSVTVPCAMPVGTALIPAASARSTTTSGVSVVAMSMSATGRPIRLLRTAPPAIRASPPSSFKSPSTVFREGSLNQSRSATVVMHKAFRRSRGQCPR